jgi:hypothetical protein
MDRISGLRRLQKYFDYDGKEALGNILEVLDWILEDFESRVIMDEIVKLSGIDITSDELPEVIKNILSANEENEIYRNFKFKKIKRSPSCLQESFLTWPYYAIYWRFEKNPEKSIKNFDVIGRSVLNFHKHVLLLMSAEEKHLNETGNKNFKKHGLHYYKSISIDVTRVIEYLCEFVKADNDILDDIYFRNKNTDIIYNFLEVLKNDSIERNSYYIKKNMKNDDNYIVYRNDIYDIYKAFIPSRRIKVGKSDNKDANRNIVKYFDKLHSTYRMLLKTELSHGTGNNHLERYNKYALQYTEREDIVIGNDCKLCKFNTVEELEESKRYSEKRVRSSLNGKQQVGSSFKQKKKNIAFSSVVTKRNLLLASDYYIPPEEIIEDFLIYSINNNNFSDIERRLFEFFIISILTGLTADDLLRALLNVGDKVVFNNNEDELIVIVNLDSSLFSKKKNNRYLNNTDGNIHYNLNGGLKVLIVNMMDYLNLFKSDNHKIYKVLNSKKVKNRYNEFIKILVKKYDKKINIKPDDTWKYIQSRRKYASFEDISTALSIGRYTSNERSNLAYTSVRKSQQSHSQYLEKIYNYYGIEGLIHKLFEENEIESDGSFKIDKNEVYSGSHNALRSEVSKKFFSWILDLINHEDDKYNKFNYYSIYTRYALSLLLGTRTFMKSLPLNDISYKMGVMKISEKSNSILSGVRIVPLSPTAERIIKHYKQEADRLNIPNDYVYLTLDGESKIYNTKDAILFLKKSNIDDWLIGFLENVPLNTGRHVFTKEAIERNIPTSYIESYLGHYGVGEEQLGIYSTMNSKKYVNEIKKLTENISKKYGVNLPI